MNLRHILVPVSTLCLGLVVGSFLGIAIERVDEGLGWADAIHVLRMGAENNDSSDQYQLGMHFLHGRGVKRDEKQAFFWIEKSAQNDFVQALFQLGWMYEKGVGVDQSSKQALSYYKRAAKFAEKALED